MLLLLPELLLLLVCHHGHLVNPSHWSAEIILHAHAHRVGLVALSHVHCAEVLHSVVQVIGLHAWVVWGEALVHLRSLLKALSTLSWHATACSKACHTIALHHGLLLLTKSWLVKERIEIIVRLGH